MAQIPDDGFKTRTGRSAFTAPGRGFPGANRPGRAGNPPDEE